MPGDRHRSPPVTPYQHFRRRWMDTVSAMNTAATKQTSTRAPRGRSFPSHSPPPALGRVRSGRRPTSRRRRWNS